MSRHPSPGTVPVRIESLVVGGEPAPWEALGFSVVGDRIPLFGAGVRVEGGPPGLHRWELSGLGIAAGEQFDIDGVPTAAVDPLEPVLVEHPLGIDDIDHVVIVTDALDRTCAALTAATGAERRRVRDADGVRQGFHRLGSVIVEVVEHPRADAVRFFGIAFNATDLDHAIDVAGAERIGSAKSAVQAGRRIATVRRAAGLGVPMAVMSVG